MSLGPLASHKIRPSFCAIILFSTCMRLREEDGTRWRWRRLAKLSHEAHTLGNVMMAMVEHCMRMSLISLAAPLSRNLELATGALGSHIASALSAAGHEVTAIQRKDSDKPAPAGLKVIKVDYQNKDELISTFTGQDVVISAVPSPQLTSEKIIIDACLAASVKRFIPSEYTTMMESPLTINLPIAKEKVLIRQYLNSVIQDTSSPTAWTSLNTGAFFDMALKYGILGPNPITKKAVFHDGGDKEIAVSLLSDIATAIVKLLEPTNFEAAANQPVYVCSAVVTERGLTKIVSEVLGVDFGMPEDVEVKKLIEESEERLKRGDMSAIIDYYYLMMYGEGYLGGEFMRWNWNERLGLRIMDEGEVRGAVREVLGDSFDGSSGAAIRNIQGDDQRCEIGALKGEKKKQKKKK
ncbi:hypothetical protein RIB2604_01704920 [Aspergillus luchuensis]|uniref:NmrA-like domain-containing protein n=1 Tax=Aspergillus kawachii TaxID=1069201 RepID=A0A146FAW1_ASPKA|nr:hypothetical protein RIB2604_01704920 [Aspergillus luchuensis]